MGSFTLFATGILYPQVNKVGLQIRAAVITSVYHKTLAVKSTGLHTFSTGEVYICTDVLTNKQEERLFYQRRKNMLFTKRCFYDCI